MLNLGFCLTDAIFTKKGRCLKRFYEGLNQALMKTLFFFSNVFFKSMVNKAKINKIK